MENKVRVVLAKLGLDVHNRGVITVATELRDAGMEVVYLGNVSTAEIMHTALQEDADVVGVSSLGGAHLSLGKALMQEAEKLEIKDSKAFIIGGVFSPDDSRELKKLGFDEVFPPGSTREKILSGIKSALAAHKSVDSGRRSAYHSIGRAIMPEWPTQYDPNYWPDPESPYWDPELETMDHQAREQKVILPKLQAQLKYAYQNSGFYKRKWDQAGIKPADVRSLKDFENIPIITKQDLREDQAEHPPFGSNLCVNYHDLARVQGTSGTTGKPTAFGVSRGDMARIANTHARVMWAMGIRPDDIVFIGSFFSLYWGSWGALAGAERLGAVAFPFGAGVPGQSDRAIEWMAAVKPTVFYGTPSYSLYLAEKAKAKGLDPAKDFNFRILFFSGEPGAGVPSTRKRIEDTFDAICCDSGSTGEMSPWMSNGECSERNGMHLWQDSVYFELVEPQTKRRVAYGEEGVTVYTHLERTSQPMIRYWAGDIARWTDEPCSCGRTYPRLPNGIYGRADDMFVVRGENVYPSAIENVLRGIVGFADEFRIVITREKTMDEMVLQVEPLPEVPKEAHQGLQQELGARMKAAGLRSVIQMMAPGSLERTEFKARRVIDQRDLYDELSRN